MENLGEILAVSDERVVITQSMPALNTCLASQIDDGASATQPGTLADALSGCVSCQPRTSRGRQTYVDENLWLIETLSLNRATRWKIGAKRDSMTLLYMVKCNLADDDLHRWDARRTWWLLTNARTANLH